jgi:hypothetical protein
MPAMTTNVEFGMYAASGKVVLGRPPEAQKMKYLDALACRHFIEIYDTLEMTVKRSMLRARGK